MADRTLAMWVGVGFYHFTAYGNGNVNNVVNMNYDNLLDGEWNYIHYGYKLINANTGNAVGWVYFSKT